MRWPIRIQWYLPTALLLAATVAVTALAGSWSAMSRATHERERQLDRIVRTFGGARVPYTPEVLERMRGLSGAEFVAAWRDRGPIAATLPIAELPSDWWELPDGQVLTVRLDGLEYRLTGLRAPGDPPGLRLFVLVPAASYSQLQREAAWPPLAIGGVTLLIQLGVSGLIALRQSRRLGAVSDGLAQIASGTFTPLASQGPDDEIADLTVSANRLAGQLSSLHAQIRRTERFRVLGQLASGLAHQLRNSVAGARLAIQLHRKRHGEEQDQTLETALRQLELMNRQTRSLLALSRSEGRPPVPIALADLIDETVLLCRPQAEHAGRELHSRVAPGPGPIVDRDDLQAALLNLITNALEATEAQGTVQVTAGPIEGGERWSVEVVDDGGGVPEELLESLFEPFVSGKPEGVGIGLTMARAAAERHGGSLVHRRDGRLTRFRMELPVPGALAGTGIPSSFDSAPPSALGTTNGPQREDGPPWEGSVPDEPGADRR